MHDQNIILLLMSFCYEMTYIFIDMNLRRGMNPNYLETFLPNEKWPHLTVKCVYFQNYKPYKVP